MTCTEHVNPLVRDIIPLQRVASQGHSLMQFSSFCHHVNTPQSRTRPTVFHHHGPTTGDDSLAWTWALAASKESWWLIIPCLDADRCSRAYLASAKGVKVPTSRAGGTPQSANRVRHIGLSPTFETFLVTNGLSSNGSLTYKSRGNHWVVWRSCSLSGLVSTNH